MNRWNSRAVWLVAALGLACWAGPPTLTGLQPRGAQKGRPFTLRIAGQNVPEGAKVISTLPATFTPIGNENPMAGDRAATYLVEPTGEWNVGVYPVRVQSADGLSNILLLSIGIYPELTEEESQPGARKNQNDSIEKAQSLPSTPLTLNGALQGPERDVYRLQAKAGEHRVFEIDARRCGSAIDPVLRVLDTSGKVIARSEDAPGIGLDARIDVTFPKEGYYYVEVRDARYSTQAQNFYRLKTGAYRYAGEVFPLGGRRGETIELTVGDAKVKTEIGKTAPQAFVSLPDSPALPLPIAAGDYPERMEGDTQPVTLPVTLNGRLGAAAEVDRYPLAVEPGDELVFHLQGRELGLSKIIGVITIYDEKGKRLASAGDGPIPVDDFTLGGTRTASDPFLAFTVPDGLRQIVVAVEDIAQRGGPYYAYRLSAARAPYDPQGVINAPYLNIPAGGTAQVAVNIDRRGFNGPLTVKPVDLPEGIQFLGGQVPAELPDTNNRNLSRRAIMSLTAAENASVNGRMMGFLITGKDDKGRTIERRARGVGYIIPVAGATEQGSVDFQRPLTGAWLGYELPVAVGSQPPAILALKLENTARKENGYEFTFRWTWKVRNSMQEVTDNIRVEVPNFNDLRVINKAIDPTDKLSGTFQVTSTQNTQPAVYNIAISARIMADSQEQDITAPVQEFILPALDNKEKPANASTSAAR